MYNSRKSLNKRTLAIVMVLAIIMSSLFGMFSTPIVKAESGQFVPSVTMKDVPTVVPVKDENGVDIKIENSKGRKRNVICLIKEDVTEYEGLVPTIIEVDDDGGILTGLEEAYEYQTNDTETEASSNLIDVYEKFKDKPIEVFYPDIKLADYKKIGGSYKNKYPTDAFVVSDIFDLTLTESYYNRLTKNNTTYLEIVFTDISLGYGDSRPIFLHYDEARDTWVEAIKTTFEKNVENNTYDAIVDFDKLCPIMIIKVPNTWDPTAYDGVFYFPWWILLLAGLVLIIIGYRLLIELSERNVQEKHVYITLTPEEYNNLMQGGKKNKKANTEKILPNKEIKSDDESADLQADTELVKDLLGEIDKD